MPEDLIESYEATTFRVAGPNGSIDIRVGRTHLDIDLLVGNVCPSEWAYITAWNPRSELLSTEQNALAQERLRRVLREGKFLFYEGFGIPDNPGWTPEASLWIAGISRVEAAAIGRQFEQNAIVVGVAGGVAELLDCRATEE